MGNKNQKKKKKEKGRQKSRNHATTYNGKLDITRSGIGFVLVENLLKDVLVRPQNFNMALHGDEVKVEITKDNPHGRSEGKIVEVLKRNQLTFMGHIELNNEFGFFVPDTDKPMPDIFIAKENLNGAKNKDRVVVKMIRWEKSDKRPVGEVVSILSDIAPNDLAMKEILLEHGFPLEFPDEVMEEAARLNDIIAADEIKRRKDYRPILTFTIDPVDAKDFDDAISIQKLDNGNYEVGVHIADVSHYVVPETALDEEAYHRATSVYLPDRVLPMLPEEISNVLCSLRPHEDKLTFSCIFQMDDKGKVKQHWIGRTIIHSDHRFTYEDVQEIIEKGEGTHSAEVLLLNKISQRLRKKRFDKGAINFSSQEVRFKLDENAKPIGIMIKESKEAHQLIEELMLLANRTVAEYVAKIKANDKPVPFPYRIHDNPDEEKLKPFVEFARKFGHKFNTDTPEKVAASFNEMLADLQGKPEQHVLEQLGIRTMAKAIYTAENIGHFGLGFEHYCHFTSPIRRYPDVMVHRILHQCLMDMPVIDKKMDAKCKHSSERERAAMEAERAANKYKQVEYLMNKIGEVYEGVVSGVASFGFWVETVEHKCEGLVSLTSLTTFDEFRHIEEDYCLVGRRSGRKFQMGEKVKIKVINANLDKRQLDYEWVM
ncbi:MAG: ribonuclease R [Sphingobacteriales bacterium]|nr:ribonuclease R [Sphingobacteriales bacterium]MBI3719349.1 ribonuclease R [Sphingobacteriales bacterium]